MKGRGEHPVDVSLEILAKASKDLDAAGLEYTDMHERLELARARGWLDGACELVHVLEHKATESGGAVPKPLRVMLAEHVRTAAHHVKSAIGALAWARSRRRPHA